LFVLQTASFAEERYIVKSGDSLYKISKTYGVSVDALKAFNRLDKEGLRLNQVLLIPAPKENQPAEIARKFSNKSNPLPPGTERGPLSPPSKAGPGGAERINPYVVKKGDSLSSISKKAGLSVDEIKTINQLRTNHLKVGQVLAVSVAANVVEDPDEETGDGEDAAEDLPEEAKMTTPVVSAEPATNSEPVSGAWRSQEERNLFVRMVKNFLGVPYRLGGSTLKGIDCSAFVKRIYEIFNTQIPRTTWEQLRIGKRVGKADLEEGDLVFFNIPSRRASNRHVGIYIGNNEFVHASSRKKEVRVDSLEAPYFNKRFLNGIRVKELDRNL
jgi:cell wall-associated NlpC family hydrolase